LRFGRLEEVGMAKTRILLVDDDQVILATLGELLQQQGFEVTEAGGVPEALKLITANVYDVLLSDLHMPGAGDGLTVVSAMRHSNPKAVTILLSAFPEMDAASHAILLQADQILVKPMNVTALVATINETLATGAPRPGWWRRSLPFWKRRPRAPLRTGMGMC